ncbi:MAG: hypothetical protein FJZ87_04650 [Chloroflexi bacterium]|nr:hypothetical protein [Chloroflexota bacterium]
MTSWMLKTDGDPLSRVREFLKAIWLHADLDGLLIPVYQTGRMSIRQAVVEKPEALADADPFVPLMQVNAGGLVRQLAGENPQRRMGVVLRACEIRALNEKVREGGLNLENWLIIGVDCLACFPEQDFNWRVEKAGSVEALTREVLRNARQGGIAPNRFRTACQMCSKPESPHVDICIDLLGLPVKQSILIDIRNDVIAEELHLERISDGRAPSELVAQRDRMLKLIEARRTRARERQLRQLGPNLPATVDQLLAFLQDCQPCIKCMEACPVHAEEMVPAVQNCTVTVEMARRWLVSCAECGMCEQACPRDVPLAAIMNRIGRELKGEALAV